MAAEVAVIAEWIHAAFAWQWRIHARMHAEQRCRMLRRARAYTRAHAAVLKAETMPDAWNTDESLPGRGGNVTGGGNPGRADLRAWRKTRSPEDVIGIHSAAYQRGQRPTDPSCSEGCRSSGGRGRPPGKTDKAARRILRDIRPPCAPAILVRVGGRRSAADACPKSRLTDRRLLSHRGGEGGGVLARSPRRGAVLCAPDNFGRVDA